MITFYADSFRTMGDWLWRARFWAHDHPVLSKVIAVFSLFFYLSFVQIQAAHAAVSFLPDGVDYTDSQGNAFSQYSMIDIDGGDVWSPGKVIVNFIVQLVWSMQYFATGVILWLFDFLLSFEWVAWLATPFNTLAQWMQEQLGTVNWIPFALMISALVGGIAIYVGRVSGGLWEMLMAAIIAVLVGGVLANPVATVTAAGGLLENSQKFGGELANSIVVDPDAQASNGASLSSAVNATLMDAFVRIPHQVISYGQVLPDECQGFYNTFIQTGEPQASLTSCAPEAAKFAHDNPGGMNILNAFVNGGGVTVMFTFGMVIAGLLMVAVVFLLIAGIKALLLGNLAVAPVDRGPFWKALSDTFMGTISLVVMTVCLALYVKLIAWVMLQTGGLPHQLRMIFLILFLIIVIVLVWRARRATLRAGRGVAGHLSKLGLGMNPGPKDSNALLKMSAIASMANTAKDMMRRRPSSPPAAAAALPQTPAAPAADPVTLTQVRDPRSGPQGGAGGGRGPSGSSGPSVGSGAARKALSAASTATSVTKGAVTIAKGAAGGGGVPGAVAAGAVVVGKAALNKTTSKAASAAAGAAARRVTPAPVDAGELKVVKVNEAPASRIEVDSRGVATARRKARDVQNVSSLPPRPTQRPSTRALERRNQLEAFRPREIAR